MRSNLTLFAQIIGTLCKNSFRELVTRYDSDKHEKGLDSWTHLITMLFCQFSGLNSLRDVTNGLRSCLGNLNHLGVRKAPCKSALSYQNKHREWHLFQDYYFELLHKLSGIAQFKQTRFRIKSKIFLLDSTTISLCLSLFDWAKYRKRKGAVKLHTLLDYDSCLPVYMNFSDGKLHDSQAAKEIHLPENSVVVADRAYIDFMNLYRWHREKSYFVVRLKNTVRFRVLKSNHCGQHPHILSDETIELTKPTTHEKYPEKLRRVVVWDQENQEPIEIVTNNFSWTAATIADLYKSRWQIEIFFKEIKQLLRIKSFLGTSPNAVLIQVWTAMITILILKYLRAIARYGWCLSNLVNFLRINLFVKYELKMLLNDPFKDESVPIKYVGTQLKLFNWGD